MLRPSTRLTVALAAILSLLPSPAAGAAPSPSQPKGTFFYPTGPGPGRLRVVMGASVDVLPRRLVESEQRHVPHLTGGIRWGLPFGFSLDARASAVILSNEAQAGLAWSSDSKHFAFDLHARTGAWFGAIGVEGFDATGFGILSSPGLTLGFPLRELRFSLGFDALVVQAQSITVGDSALHRNRLMLEGVAMPFVVESLLPNGGAFYYGVTLLWARPDYQLWLAFSDSRTRQLYPRFVAGYEF